MGVAGEGDRFEGGALAIEKRHTALVIIVAAIVCIGIATTIALSPWIHEAHPRVHSSTPSLCTATTQRGRGSRAQQPITASEYVKMLGVGIDVDWMSFKKIHQYYFYWRSKGVNVAKLFRERGFTNVRIRISGDVVMNRTLLRELGEVVEDCLRAGLIPIIAYSADELRQHPQSPEAAKHFVEWWRTVAEYFKGWSYLISFDLIIETSGPIKKYPQILNKVYNETIRAIRSIDRYRIIIVTPANGSKPFALKYLRVPWDPYILVEWHIYAGGPCPRRRCPSTTPVYDPKLIERAVEIALNWSREHHVPTWVGAWRPNCYPKHVKSFYPDGAPRGLFPVKEVLGFVKLMACTLCSHGIPFDINADAKFFNIEKLYWYPSQRPILDTIFNCCKNLLNNSCVRGH